MEVMARYFPAYTVTALYTYAPLVALIAVDIWWLANYLSRSKRDHDRASDTRSDTEDTKE
jgi:hypothetical protein